MLTECEVDRSRGLTYFQSANLHGKFAGTPRSCHRENSPLAAMVTREYYLPVASQLKEIQRDSVKLQYPIDIHLWEKKFRVSIIFFPFFFISYKKQKWYELGSHKRWN